MNILSYEASAENGQNPYKGIAVYVHKYMYMYVQNI